MVVMRMSVEMGHIRMRVGAVPMLIVNDNGSFLHICMA